MKIISFLFFLLFSFPGFSQTYKGTILSVTDGDTYVFQTENGSLKIRSEGIDAPEMKQPFGDSAALFLKDYVNLNAIVIASGTDRYGRTIGTLYINGEDINKKLVLAGYAWFYKNYSKNQDYKNAEILARKKATGLWSQANPVAPWDWRNKTDKLAGPKLTKTQVIICSSTGSYSYHKYYCPGLKRCKSEYKTITMDEAKNLGKKECGYCFPDSPTCLPDPPLIFSFP